MNNPLLKLGQFLFAFILVTSLMMGVYYLLKDSPFKPLYLSLSPGKNKTLCEESPQKIPYSTCTHRFISSLVDKASPLELLKIPGLLDEIKKQDIFHKVHAKDKIIRAYAQNQLTFFENLQSFGINRKNFDYFQILIRPIIYRLLKEKLEEVKKETKVNKNSFPEESHQRLFKRLQSIQITN